MCVCVRVSGAHSCRRHKPKCVVHILTQNLCSVIRDGDEVRKSMSMCVLYINCNNTLHKWMLRVFSPSLWDICYCHCRWHITAHGIRMYAMFRRFYIDQTWQIDYAMQQLLNYRHCLFFVHIYWNIVFCCVFIVIYGRVMHFNWVCHWVFSYILWI